MRVVDEPLPGVKLLAPKVIEDGRGFFMESYSRDRYADLYDLAPVGYRTAAVISPSWTSFMTSSRTTTRARPAASYAGSTTSSAMPRPSWFV